MEFEIVKFFNHLWAGTFVDQVTFVISKRSFLLILFFLILAAIYIFEKKDRKKIIAGLILSVIFYYIFSEFLFKYFITNFIPGRIRPYIAHPGEIFPIGSNMSNDSSFPSSHMVGAVAFFWSLIYHYRKLIIPGTIFVFIVAFARLHNGMHYPSDIIAGVIIGIFCGSLALFTINKIKI